MSPPARIQPAALIPPKPKRAKRNPRLKARGLAIKGRSDERRTPDNPPKRPHPPRMSRPISFRSNLRAAPRISTRREKTLQRGTRVSPVQGTGVRTDIEEIIRSPKAGSGRAGGQGSGPQGPPADTNQADRPGRGVSMKIWVRTRRSPKRRVESLRLLSKSGICAHLAPHMSAPHETPRRHHRRPNDRQVHAVQPAGGKKLALVDDQRGVDARPAHG